MLKKLLSRAIQYTLCMILLMSCVHIVCTHVYVKVCLPKGRFIIDGYFQSILLSSTPHCKLLGTISMKTYGEMHTFMSNLVQQIANLI